MRAADLFRTPKRRALWWLLLSACVVAADFLAGPRIQFPILFLVPVGLATWYDGRRWGILLAVALPMIRMIYVTIGGFGLDVVEAGTNALIRILAFVSYAVLIEKVSQQHRALKKEVRTLRGMLPICCNCKKIRTDDQSWQQLERYITDHSEAEFTHGLCPECAKKLYGFNPDSEDTASNPQADVSSRGGRHGAG